MNNKIIEFTCLTCGEVQDADKNEPVHICNRCGSQQFNHGRKA